MPTAYRISKTAHPVLDGAGAYLMGGRWNSPGRHAIYASTCLAGSLLEVLAHAGPRGKLPGPHHCARADIPDDVEIEVVDESALPGWDAADPISAREYGDGWLAEGRTAVLSVPAMTARPYGRHLILNPEHPEYGRIRAEPSVPIAWDARLFRI
jgi:RES domain-containing protein